VDDQRGLSSTLTLGVRANLTKVCVFGHAHGGKPARVAFAVALSNAKGKLVALFAAEPVDGMGVGNRASKRHYLLDSVSHRGPRGTGPATACSMG